MHGRNCSRILAAAAIALMAAIPLSLQLHAQARGGDRPVAFSALKESPSALPDLALPDLPHEIPLPVQPPARLPVSSGTLGLAQIARAAGTIFSGTVISVSSGEPADDLPRSNRPSGTQTLETVAIRFQVEHSIRGARVGEQLTISQWKGAWSAGQRYLVGERVLVFLYPESKLGLTSSVAGALGRFHIDALGHVTLTEPQRSAFHADPVLGGRLHVNFEDFARSIQRVSAEAGVLR
jgi:hypothetical protein